MTRRVLVLGGSGFVGRHLCAKLCAAGHAVTVPTRRARHAQALWPLPGVTVLEHDLRDDARLAALVAGHDAVVNLIAILHGNAAAFEAAHVELPARLARACIAAGVPRLLHVSALGAAADAPSMYQRSKARGEQGLRDAPLALTVLRPSVIFGADDRFLNLFAALQRWLPVLPLAGAATRFAPVWVEDVAQALLRCLDGPASIGQTYECAGPEVWTLADLVRLAGRLSGHPRPVLPLPARLGRAQALLMEWLPGPTLMSRDNIDSMRVDNVASGQWPGLDALGIRPAALSALAPTWLGPSGQPASLAQRRGAGR